MARPVPRPPRCIPALGAVFFVSLGLAACGGGIPSDAVVQVGGTPITKTTFDHWMNVAAASSSATSQSTTKPAVPVPPDYKACIAQLRATSPKPAAGQPTPTDAQFKAQCEQEYKSLQTQVLGFLISAQWVLSEASSQGVSVKDSDVQKQFNTIKQQQFPNAAQFQQFLKTSGQSIPDLLLRVKLDLLSTKLRDKVTKAKGNVTTAQISNYYNQNKTRFGQPARRDLKILLVKTKAQADAAKKQIQSGQSFAAVAKKVSIDRATKAQGGSLVGVARGQQEKALDAAVFSAQRGVLSGPIQTPFGYYVFQVQKITPASQQTLAQAKASIQQQLTAQQQQAALTSFVSSFQKKWKSKTDCRSGYVVADCKQYKAPAVTPATGATGAPATGATP